MIETNRLLLRPFVTQDAADLLEYRREPLVNCFACMKLNTLEGARAEAEKLAAQPESCLAIVLKDSGKVIGEIEGHPESASPEEDPPADTVSPCWMLHKDYQGKGYAFEAAQAFFDHLFRDKGIRRIYAYTEDYNLSCQRLCEKLGMRREGLFLEFVSFVNNPDGTPLYENTFQYAILKKEWLARK
ncbi:MAG: GNAT family N-acetyltransferase [Clostridia bacterium]|nr:GNAT family N-acetyltransferase [Clostridia bacterium]